MWAVVFRHTHGRASGEKLLFLLHTQAPESRSGSHAFVLLVFHARGLVSAGGSEITSGSQCQGVVELDSQKRAQ